MKIKHLQKTTLIDYPGEIACLLFLYGCTFRCGFCYNAGLVIKEETEDIPKEEILQFLEKRKNQLTGICITGGEPLMTLEKEFLQEIKKMGYKIKIDTNGTFPEKLNEFLKDGLIDYVAMDIKGCKKDYALIANVKLDISKIEKSIKIISQMENYEFRTTILKKFHNKENINEMFLWLKELTNKKLKNYSFQGFKNVGNFVDKEFEKEDNTRKEFLENLKLIGTDFCENISVKY